MCLDIKRTSIIKTAKSDIICYKYVYCDQYKNDIYYFMTPFKRASVRIGETYTSKLKRSGLLFGNKIENGLHSFKFVNECYQYSNTKIMVRCVIPKGAKYYEGTFDCYFGYASSVIIYEKLVENF